MLPCSNATLAHFSLQGRTLNVPLHHRRTSWPFAGPDAAAHVLSSIGEKQGQLSALRAACSEKLLSYTQCAQGHLAEVAAMQQRLVQLGQCILSEQPALDQVRVWAVAAVE